MTSTYTKIHSNPISDDNLNSNFHYNSINITNNHFEQDKKEIIKNIQKIIGEYKTKEQSILIQNLFQIISSDIYADERRFIAGIIQNSDDASVVDKELRIHIHLFQNHILIGHYGKEFDEHDVKSICFAEDFTKNKNKDTTGYKGIGFKSLFNHAKKVFIISGGYQFRFEENYCKDMQYPWQIYPIWSTEKDISNEEIFSMAKDYKVSFIIEIKNPKILQECKQKFFF